MILCSMVLILYLWYVHFLIFYFLFYYLLFILLKGINFRIIFMFKQPLNYTFFMRLIFMNVFITKDLSNFLFNLFFLFKLTFFHVLCMCSVCYIFFILMILMIKWLSGFCDWGSDAMSSRSTSILYFQNGNNSCDFF